ncbi:MAG TPA: hypothetical protein VID27_10785 [Blastocatellia bacterium]|jgi:hypothetical protein
MQVCRFCSAPIDQNAAAAAASVLDRVNEACSQGSYIKIAARTIPVFFGLSFVPFISWACFLGLIFLLILVPGMIIHWWVKFGGVLKVNDPDIEAARKSVMVALAIWALMFVVSVLWFFVIPAMT